MTTDEKTPATLLNVISFTSKDLEARDNVLTTIISPHTGKEVQITSNVDQAMDFVLQHGEVTYDKERDRKLLWKIDLYLMPVMCLLYCFQFMDKLSNSYASILGLRTELHMHGNMYAWTGTAFYLGYLAFEFPAVQLLQRFPVAKTVGVFIITWGVVLCLHSVPQYAGFIALRTILGMLELSVTPAFVILTSQYYRKEETFLRTAMWFASNGLGTILGSGAIAHSLIEHQASYTLPAWKLVFIVTGCLTIGIGIVVIAHIPDTPTQAWFLTEEEKMLVVERIRVNQQGFGNRNFKIHQFKEAFMDVKTWLFFFFALASDIPNGGITNFGSILLTEDLKYTVKESLLMQMPFGAVEFVGCILFAYCYRFYQSRMFWAALATTIAVMGQCFLAFSNNNKLALAGYSIYGLSPLGFICILSSISSNVTGHTKKVTGNAIVLVGYCVGNLIGPQTFLASEAPTYKTAKICIVAFGASSLATILAIWFYYWRENMKRDKRGYVKGEVDMIENFEFADLTDLENPLFRYSM